MPTTAVLVQDCEGPITSSPSFSVSLAQNVADLTECQRLRFQVFNRELGEGLESSERTGLDRDQFDWVCDHLMVRDLSTGVLVGTYRMQTGYRAQGNLGYYSEQLFDFAPFEPIRGELLELGRACVHSDYRSTTALAMLWKGIASYAALCNARYMIGCSSITSQDENEGAALFEELCEKYLAPEGLRTLPKPPYRCEPGDSASRRSAPEPPRLFRAYLDISARLCGPPAI
ncbi:MAG: GNAT family N-acetyltransferase, partial [Acidobacteria bacterium]|nr:GNAT family N-acetyltransferase [Acidobacteriota bacterium]